MIVYRQVDSDFLPSGRFWHVEYYDSDVEGRPFPLGTAYVDFNPDGDAPQLSFVLVADDWRRRGIGVELIQACRRRWPTIVFSGHLNSAGEAVVRKADRQE